MFNIKREYEKDVLKEAFERVKEDIFNLSNEISSIRSELISIKEILNTLDNEFSTLKEKSLFNSSSISSPPLIHSSSIALPLKNSTQNQYNPTEISNPTQNPTVPSEIGGLKYPFLGVSIGNRGVPTDKPTNQQTDNPTGFSSISSHLETSKSLKQHILDATDILNSLDNLRKEVRIKFKAITNQEMVVFSTVYDLEQLFPEGVEYEQIASKLRLSPSSIRDYIQRLINKGVPIIKTKVNNKKILLSISSELKKIASLDTIIKLREL